MFDSPRQQADFYTRYTRPFCNSMADAINRKNDVRTSVVVLFKLCGPSNISRFVVSIVVDAIKRVISRWSDSHVFKEGSKRVIPTFADLDTASTVVVVDSKRRIVTPTSHVYPCVILRSRE